MARVTQPSVEPCELHGVSNCAYCRPTLASLQAGAIARPLRGPWFEARLTRRCSNCDNTIHPGCQIRADGQGGYLCPNCGYSGAITDL
jgi:hypothetical protein